jgi:restriction system protein
VKLPTQYEHFVAEYFKTNGFKAEVTPETNDYGLDVILTRGKEKIAVQAKMYGGSTRKVNRKSFMELHGAKSVFGCTKAMMVTDGEVSADAQEVASKLAIEIIYLPFKLSRTARFEKQLESKDVEKGIDSFDEVWREYVIPLVGKTITGPTGLTNKIVKVDTSGVTRITKNSTFNKIPIEPFRWAINRILTKGSVTRDEINQEFVDRLSSGTVLILSQISIFDTLRNPLRIVKKQ